jgi:hypothetical protein
MNTQVLRSQMHARSAEMIKPKQEQVSEILSVEQLPKKVIQEGLSGFTRNSQGLYAFLALSLNDKKLTSLIGVEKYRYLETISLRNNGLITVKELGQMSNLQHIDLAHNSLATIQDSLIEGQLISLDLSHNSLIQFPDISRFICLRELNLAHNSLKVLKNSEVNLNLKYLNLSGNQLNSLRNLMPMTGLRHLIISNCGLSNFEGLETFTSLEKVEASNNSVTELCHLQHLENLIHLNISQNSINDIGEIYCIQNLRFLCYLDARDNPFESINFYKYLVLHALPQLIQFDGQSISSQERADTDVFFGKDLNDRRKIFERYLPQEKFTDLRLYHIGNVVVHKTELEDVDDQAVETFDYVM